MNRKEILINTYKDEIKFNNKIIEILKLDNINKNMELKKLFETKYLYNLNIDYEYKGEETVNSRLIYNKNIKYENRNEIIKEVIVSIEKYISDLKESIKGIENDCGMSTLF